MKSLLLRKITREIRIKRHVENKIKLLQQVVALNWKYKEFFVLFLLRLRVLKRNGEKMKTHYKSQQQKTITYYSAKMENTDIQDK